jgi:hypothetical protein
VMSRSVIRALGTVTSTYQMLLDLILTISFHTIALFELH